MRSRYAALFQAIAELAWVRYGERPSTKFEEVKKVSQKGAFYG